MGKRGENYSYARKEQSFRQLVLGNSEVIEEVAGKRIGLVSDHVYWGSILEPRKQGGLEDVSKE